MRRRGPSLMRVAATTAVVAGTANAVSHHQDQKYQAQAQAQYNDQMSQQQMAEMQAQQNALAQQQAAMMAQQQAAPAPAAGGISQDQINQLQQMAQLLESGILTQAEFDAKKKQILGL